MTDQVRCAVLGLGRLGYFHAKHLAGEVRGAELAAVCDPMKGKAEARFRLSLHRVTDGRKLGSPNFAG